MSSPNIQEKSEYHSTIDLIDKIVLDETFDLTVTKKEVIDATKKIAVDTAPGPDNVLVRSIKDDNASYIIAKIATRILKTNQVPTCFKQARTVLIYKGGDEKNINNWRPITICSVIRRIIERIFNSRLHIT